MTKMTKRQQKKFQVAGNRILQKEILAVNEVILMEGGSVPESTSRVQA
jgi:hypothetical protein